MTVSIKPLEWRDEPVPPSGETLAPSVVGLYCIPHSGDRFYLRFRDAVTLGDYSTLDKAKAAAQSDYEARIRSALSAQVQDVAGWQLVPVNMTAAMINAWSGGKTVSTDENAYHTTFQDAWARVLAAAPAKQEG